MTHRADILTKRQVTVLNQINWCGDVEKTYGAPIPGGYTHEQADYERAYRGEIRRLTRRGYLSRGRLSARGKAVVNADWWTNPVLREFVMESKR